MSARDIAGDLTASVITFGTIVVLPFIPVLIGFAACALLVGALILLS